MSVTKPSAGRLVLGLLLLSTLLPVGPGFAQDEAPQAPIPFAGGKLTITEDAETGEKVIAFDGKELARNYLVYFDRIVDLNDKQVALFAAGDGGNQCGPAEVIVWKPEGSDIQSQLVGEECGAPPAAVTGSSIYFVPYLLPGENGVVQMWTPEHGLETAGAISFSPEPGTDWKDLDPARSDFIIDTLKNAAVHAAAVELLGDRLLDVVSGLQTGGNTETTPAGLLYGSGCVPHACGSADAFMAIDPKARKLYFAQQGEEPQPSAWPQLKTWPNEIRQLMQAELGR